MIGFLVRRAVQCPAEFDLSGHGALLYGLVVSRLSLEDPMFDLWGMTGACEVSGQHSGYVGSLQAMRA